MRKLWPYIAVLITFVAWTAGAAWLGFDYADTAATAAAEKDKRTATDALLKANQRATRAEKALADAGEASDKQRFKEQANAKAQRDDFIARVRSGAVRVSIPVRAAQFPAQPTDRVASAQSEQARSELAPEAAAALGAIAGDGDAAIIDLNTCIDKYNDARQRIARFYLTQDEIERDQKLEQKDKP